jgi:uncharacterized membrane protein YdjX (TVP38/TMEM64 family)
MTLYTVNLFYAANAYSRPLGRRLMARHRAQRVVAWLRRNGFDAYIAPVRVTT